MLPETKIIWCLAFLGLILWQCLPQTVWLPRLLVQAVWSIFQICNFLVCGGRLRLHWG